MEGRRIRVRGQVQGVGFRPFIWQLAARMGLRGEVLNDAEGVLIHVAGADLDAFERAIIEEAPPLAVVDAIVSEVADVAEHDGFIITASGGPGAETRVTPDAASCSACLAEVRDPRERRYLYPFTNCTHCGPRFTILNSLPYDRAKTTMAPFEMCADCRREYENPADRRFHAQPVACPVCGPRVWVEETDGREISGDALDVVTNWLRAGRIVAIKGLGGFHLACDARNANAIAELRHRKRRPAKPFALMAREIDLASHAAPSEDEWGLLRDSAAPIVLLDRAGEALPDGVAPGQATLGWMLPYTPLHHLICDAFEGPLVMTSGNLSGEPQVIDNAEAREKLGTFVDGFLMHDRDIARRLDDSVERLTVQGPMVLRRARGRVPGTLRLPEGLPNRQVVAYGGQMKAAICLVKNGEALLGHHLGELDEALTWDAFRQADRDYAALFDHRPEAAVCDLHPGYRATRHAQATGLPVVEVQHHHAHLAACLAENGWPVDGGPVAGIVLDGLGLGTDGTVWGGEVLVGDYAGFSREAWLAPAPLPGGDAASREPWRNLMARLDAAGLEATSDELLPGKPLAPLRRAVATGVSAPLSSSAGRLFDAFAAALGICPDAQSFEGEAPMRLEALALGAPRVASDAYRFAEQDGALDPSPLFHAWLQDRRIGTPREVMAMRFHAGLATAFADAACRLVETGQARAVALTGGCFQNALLLDLTIRALQDLSVLIHTRTPANDGGLALGQAVVALAQMEAD